MFFMSIGLCSLHPVAYFKEYNYINKILFSLYVNLRTEKLTIRYSYEAFSDTVCKRRSHKCMYVFKEAPYSLVQLQPDL